MRLAVHFLKRRVAFLSSHFESSVDQIFMDFLGAGDTAMGSINFCSYMLVGGKAISKYIL